MIKGMRFNVSLPASLNPGRGSVQPAPRAHASRQWAALAIGVLLCSFRLAQAQQQGAPMASMPGMDMDGDMTSMKDMGPSMAAMAHHMRLTALRPKKPGDDEKVKAVVEQVRASIERYRDYRQALKDGFAIANPDVDQPQSHFNSEANIQEAARHFDPTKPSSLLYFKTDKQKYRLEGVMFTMPPTASEDELNDRIPLSVVRWHEHVKFCAAPANRVQEYFGKKPRFGMFGSIDTPETCKAEGGTFFPVIFTWMIHVFPFETDLKNIFSMNDDIPHFGLEHP